MAPDDLSIVDWILRLSNVLGLGVLFNVARKIGAFEQLQVQLRESQTKFAGQLGDVSSEIKALSRIVYETIGSLRGGNKGGDGRFPL